LTDIVENINGEFDEIEAQTGDIVCVHELWSRYMKKVNMRLFRVYFGLKQLITRILTSVVDFCSAPSFL
jgi:hypothetical protein